MSGKIEWCDKQANPFHGCKHGCAYCYARRFALRHGGNPQSGGYYALAQAGRHPFEPAFSLDRLDAIAKRLAGAKRRWRVFIGSMGDIGGAWDYHQICASGDVIVDHLPRRTVQTAVAAMIQWLPQHTFLLLTKNPCGLADIAWPANAHVGVSVSGTEDAVDRCERLDLRVEAGLRWVSVEPLLDQDFDPGAIDHDGIGWVVVGAQTGARQHVSGRIVDAAARIVQHCEERKVPCFVKDNLARYAPERAWPRQLPAQGRK